MSKRVPLCGFKCTWPSFTRRHEPEPESTKNAALTLKSKEELRAEHLPNPLPVLPPSGLSFSDDIDDSYQQGQSPLFKLPYELREQIYRYALGYHFVHIICTRKRLAHVSCFQRRRPKRSTYGHACWGYMVENGLIWLRALSGQHGRHSSLMGVVRSCRRAYA